MQPVPPQNPNQVSPNQVPPAIKPNQGTTTPFITNSNQRVPRFPNTNQFSTPLINGSNQAIQGIPGVVSINDQLAVNSQANTTATSTSSMTTTGAVSGATSAGNPLLFGNQSRFNTTNQFGFKPNGGPFLFTNRNGEIINLTPTGRTNFQNRIFYNPTNPPPLTR
jgi:hypothetical protein